MSSGIFSSLMNPTAREIVRSGVAVVRRRAGALLAPVVIWQHIKESYAAFDVRVAALRAALPASAPLIAVESGRRSTPSAPGVTRAAMAASHFELLHPSRPARYRCATGGRGSGKSHSFATVTILNMLQRRLRELCAREIQRSLRESVHRLLSDVIVALGLSRYFVVTDHSIVCTITGAEVIFVGLYQNVSQIKSIEGIDVCWVEEAESVSARSLELLTPTIRRPGSELWFSANPDDPVAPIMAFATNDRPGCRHSHSTFRDNPWVPTELVAEAAYLRGVDDDAYRHVWLGECRTATDAQVFRGKAFVEEFTAGGDGWNGPYAGLDFGFSQDPTAAVKAWVKDRTVYVEHEAWAIGRDIDATPALLDTVPGFREITVRADNARPETISYLQRHGYWRCVPVEKWPGSVEDGIAHLRQYERIVIHPRCKHVADEMRLYSFKVDRLSGDVMADVVDANNHTIDALRYALAPLIRRSKMGFLDYIDQERARLAAQTG
jgi:phage terminase large subunit